MLRDTGQAGTTEIEVTPAMIEAGVSLFLTYDPEWDDARERVRAILQAALEVSEQTQSAAD